MLLYKTSQLTLDLAGLTERNREEERQISLPQSVCLSVRVCIGRGNGPARQALKRPSQLYVVTTFTMALRLFG